MRPIEILKKAEGLKFTSEDGDTDELELLPPLTPDEIDKLQAKLPCRIPEEICELTSVPTLVGCWVATIRSYRGKCIQSHLTT
jgi:hypothetical protein